MARLRTGTERTQAGEGNTRPTDRTCPPGDTAAPGKGTRTALSSSGTNRDGPAVLGLGTPSQCRGTGPTPGPGTRSHRAQLKIPQASMTQDPACHSRHSQVFFRKTQHPRAQPAPAVQAAPRERNTVAVPVPDTGGGGEAEGSWLRARRMRTRRPARVWRRCAGGRTRKGVTKDVRRLPAAQASVDYV